MGFNFGAFAGAAAKTGVDTYERLNEEDRRKAAEARANEQFEAWRKDQEKLRKIDEAAADTYSRVGKAALTGDLQKDTGIGAQQAQGLQVNSGDAAFDAADRAQLSDTLRANAQAQGAATPALPTYTREQAAKDYADRLYAIDPTKAQQAEAGALTLKKGGLEVKGLERQAAFDDKFDKAMNSLHQESATRLTDITTTAETGGMKGLADKFGPELKKALGADVQLVGNNLIVKTPGQKPQTISSLSQAVDALKGAAQLEFAHKLETRMLGQGLFKTPQELMTYLHNKETNALKGREVAAKEALVPSEINKNNASAGASSAMARINNMSADNREKAAALYAKWEALTPEQQSGAEGMAIQREFNMLNVKAGGTVPLGSSGGKQKGNVLQTPVDIKKNDDGTYTAFAKDGGHALYNTINGEAIPLGMDVSTYQSMKKAAQDNGVKLVAGEENGRLVLRYIGADGKPYEDPGKARYAKAPETGAANTPAKEAPQTAIPAPDGSPVAKAAANRAANNARMKDAEAARREKVQQAIETSRQTTATTPQARFEVDRKTMSKAELLRRYGNGAGLTDEQYMYLMQ